MNRGVPPTARNARTGELTPPGIDFWARSKSSALFMVQKRDGCEARGPRGPRDAFGKRRPAGRSSVHAARRHAGAWRQLLGCGLGGFLGLRLLFLFLFLGGGKRPEEAIGNHAAHARAEAR